MLTADICIIELLIGCETHIIVKTNENVDIQFSSHNTFLE